MGRIFVVQKYRLARAHYDLRLEIDGVLASWAIPKGPSLNPVDNRAAIMTDEHFIEDAKFEGVIAPGNYGAGPVMIWDRGSYELAGSSSADAQLRRGEIQFALRGVKLRGEFVLARASRAKKWRLIKQRDEHADLSWDIESLALDRSIVTGRTLEEIASGHYGKQAASGGVGMF